MSDYYHGVTASLEPLGERRQSNSTTHYYYYYILIGAPIYVSANGHRRLPAHTGSRSTMSQCSKSERIIDQIQKSGSEKSAICDIINQGGVIISQNTIESITFMLKYKGRRC